MRTSGPLIGRVFLVMFASTLPVTAANAQPGPDTIRLPANISTLIIVVIVVGLIAGWLAGLIMRGTGFGTVADLCIGLVGAFIGSWLLPQLGTPFGMGSEAAIVGATVGAAVPLITFGLFR